jgi:drug/metabolite transporter (DMT)-like permease
MVLPLVYVVCALVWGTTWFAIRRCIGEGGYPTYGSAAIRFVIAAAILGAIYALGFGRPRPTRRQVGAIVLAGLLGGASYGLIYTAEQRISGGLACVLYGTFPLATALAARIAGVERVSRRAIAGCVVALGGIAIVYADRLEASSEQAAAVTMVLVSVVASAIYSTLLKRAAATVSPIVTTGIFLATAAVPLSVAGVVADVRPLPWPPPLNPTLALLYLAIVGSVLVFIAYFYLLKHVTLMTVSTLVLVEPIVALAADAAWEREVVLDAGSYLGMLVTLAGVGVSVLERPRKRAAATESAS